MEQTKNDVLKVKRLHVEFQTSHGMVHAVKDVSLEVKRGRIHALVGESGSGKSVTSLTIMNLLAGNGKVISGDVTLNEKSLLKLSGKEKRQLYGDRIGMIFQDPTAALDPLFTVEQSASGRTEETSQNEQKTGEGSCVGKPADDESA